MFKYQSCGSDTLVHILEDPGAFLLQASGFINEDTG